MNDVYCPICDSENVTALQQNDSAWLSGIDYLHSFTRCNKCNCEFETWLQMQANDRRAAEVAQ